MTTSTTITIPSSDKAFRETRQSLAALALRIAGATYTEVAEALGLADAAEARCHVEGALANSAINHADIEHLRQEEAARLDRLQRGVWQKAIDPDHPDQFQAAAIVLKIMESRRRLLGLDAPTQVAIHTPTQDELERWVANVTHAQHAEYAALEANVIDVEPVAVVQ